MSSKFSSPFMAKSPLKVDPFAKKTKKTKNTSIAMMPSSAVDTIKSSVKKVWNKIKQKK